MPTAGWPRVVAPVRCFHRGRWVVPRSHADGVSVRARAIVCLLALHCTKFRRQRA